MSNSTPTEISVESPLKESTSSRSSRTTSANSVYIQSASGQISNQERNGTTNKNGNGSVLKGDFHLTSDIKNMTIAELLNFVSTHQTIAKDIASKKTIQPPTNASLEEKVNYAISELELTQKAVAETKVRYQNSITNLQKATEELQNNNQILIQNKLEIQENKIESQRTRIELNSLKQETIDEIKNLNEKIDLLLNNYSNNFKSLHQTVVSTLQTNLEKKSFAKPKVSHSKRPHHSNASNVTQDESFYRSGTEEAGGDFRYKLAKPLTNVRQIWEEYEYGLYGQPSVKSLDAQYKNRWRFKGENTTYLRRRKIFIAIENCIKTGISENDAIEALENLRVDETGTKRTMAWLFDNIPDNFPESYFGGEKPATQAMVEEDVEMSNASQDESGLDAELAQTIDQGGKPQEGDQEGQDAKVESDTDISADKDAISEEAGTPDEA